MTQRNYFDIPKEILSKFVMKYMEGIPRKILLKLLKKQLIVLIIKKLKKFIKIAY